MGRLWRIHHSHRRQKYHLLVRAAGRGPDKCQKLIAVRDGKDETPNRRGDGAVRVHVRAVLESRELLVVLGSTHFYLFVRGSARGRQNEDFNWYCVVGGGKQSSATNGT